MNPRKKTALRVVAVLLVAALAVGGWLWWRGRTDDATAQGLTASGSVEAREYQVTPATAGAVTKVTVREGDTVKAGQVLAQLDARAATLQVTQAQKGVDAAQAALDQAKSDKDSAAEIRAAQARVDQAKAQVNLAKVQLGYATVTAPHAGTVATLTTNVGQNASPAKALATIIDPADLYVRTYVPEPRLGEVRIGGKAQVSAAGAPAPYEGQITYVSSRAEFTPNTVETQDQRTKLVYEVRVRVTDTSGALKPGMPVDVAFR